MSNQEEKKIEALAKLNRDETIKLIKPELRKSLYEGTNLKVDK